MSRIDELERLAKLKKQGVLTEKEFQATKKEILANSNSQSDKPQKTKIVKKQNKSSVEINDAYVWIIAVAPIALTILLYSIGITDEMWTSWVIWFIFNSVFCVLDDTQIQKAYKVPSNVWYLFLIPVYLYKRSEIVGDNKAYFWTWIICFVFSIL